MTSSQPVSDPLSHWTDGPAKRGVLEAIASMTDESSQSFVELRRRIATFDNDGTLWCEKPIPVQAQFLLKRWRAMAQEDPGRREVQPYKAAAERDVAWFSDLYAHVGELLKGAGEAYEGITPDEFEDAVLAFLDSARHPRFDVPLHHLTYLPMVQLMEVLRGNGFKVLIGDIQMLQSARFALLLRHDDAEREYAYDTGIAKALAAAEEHDWVVVSMRSDFAHVFAGDPDLPAG